MNPLNTLFYRNRTRQGYGQWLQRQRPIERDNRRRPWKRTISVDLEGHPVADGERVQTRYHFDFRGI